MTWYEEWKKCMSGLGLPAPDGLGEDALAMAAAIAAIADIYEKYGTAVTVAELAGAGTTAEAAQVLVGALSAAYLGACTGCVATATEAYAKIGPFANDDEPQVTPGPQSGSGTCYSGADCEGDILGEEQMTTIEACRALGGKSWKGNYADAGCINNIE